MSTHGTFKGLLKNKPMTGDGQVPCDGDLINSMLSDASMPQSVIIVSYCWRQPLAPSDVKNLLSDEIKFSEEIHVIRK